MSFSNYELYSNTKAVETINPAGSPSVWKQTAAAADSGALS